MLLAVACGTTAAPDEQAEEAGTADVAPTEGGATDAETPAPADATPGADVAAPEPGPGDQQEAPADAPSDAPAQDQPDDAAPDAPQPTEPGVEQPGPDERTGRGVSASELRIGVEILGESQAEFIASFGAEGGGQGHNERQAQAVVDHLNANGGIAGRTIVPVYTDADTDAQARCAALTQDDEVFAVVSTLNTGDTGLECYSAVGTILIRGGHYNWDHAVYDRFARYFYTPSLLSLDRSGVYVDGLNAQGYFDETRAGVGEVRVGLVRFDSPRYERQADNVIAPRLAAIGLELTEEIAVTEPAATTQLQDMAVQLGNAVLRLQSRGVTHVLFGEWKGILPYFFMPQAESQGYRPRYGLMSYQNPQLLAANMPVEQVRKSMAVGWAPALDVDPPQDPGDNPESELCRRINEEAGLTYAPVDRQPWYFALSYCDAFFFLKAAIERSATLDAAGLQAAVEGIGTAYASPATFGTAFGPGHHDGVDRWRPLAFLDDCRCYAYQGGNQPVSR